MTTATAPRVEVCPEYQSLLQQCQQCFALWQQRQRLTARPSSAAKRPTVELQRLQANYTRAYSLLEDHERTCSICQYISKIAGLDFESLSEALVHYRRAQ